jgi:hypothetical protein
MRRRGVEYGPTTPLHATVEARVAAQEARLVDATVEHGRAYDAAGNLVCQALGTPDRLRFGCPRRELRDRVVSHNHTNGTSFSAADLAAARYYGLRELRVISRDATGQAWLFRLQPPDSGWPRLTEDMAMVYLRAAERAAQDRVLGRGVVAVLAEVDWQNHYTHYRMEHVASHFGMRYNRSQVDL